MLIQEVYGASLGKSPINKCSFSTPGTSSTAGTRVNPCEKDVEGSVGDTMGGEIPTDSSGTLKYVRVQYAGYEVFHLELGVGNNRCFIYPSS